MARASFGVTVRSRGNLNLEFMVSLLLFAMIFGITIMQYTQSVNRYLAFSYEESLRIAAQQLIWQLTNDAGCDEACDCIADKNCDHWGKNNYLRIGFADANEPVLSIQKLHEFSGLYDEAIKSARNYTKMVRAMNMPNKTFHMRIERVPTLSINAIAGSPQDGYLHCYSYMPICGNINKTRSNITAIFYVNRSDVDLNCIPFMLKEGRAVVQLEPLRQTRRLCEVEYVFEDYDAPGTYTILALLNSTEAMGYRAINMNVIGDEPARTVVLFPPFINCSIYPIRGSTCSINLEITAPSDLRGIRIKPRVHTVIRPEGEPETRAVNRYQADIELNPDHFAYLRKGDSAIFSTTFFMNEPGIYHGNFTIIARDEGGNQITPYVAPFQVSVEGSFLITERGVPPPRGTASASVERYVTIKYPSGEKAIARMTLVVW